MTAKLLHSWSSRLLWVGWRVAKSQISRLSDLVGKRVIRPQGHTWINIWTLKDKDKDQGVALDPATTATLCMRLNNKPNRALMRIWPHSNHYCYHRFKTVILQTQQAQLTILKTKVNRLKAKFQNLASTRHPLTFNMTLKPWLISSPKPTSRSICLRKAQTIATKHLKPMVNQGTKQSTRT